MGSLMVRVPKGAEESIGKGARLRPGDEVYD